MVGCGWGDASGMTRVELCLIYRRYLQEKVIGE